jgi:putative transposase
MFGTGADATAGGTWLAREYRLQPKASLPVRGGDRQRSRWTDLARPREGMAVDGPNQLWMSDITYAAVTGGVVYVAVIFDAWSRVAVGYAVVRSRIARMVQSSPPSRQVRRPISSSMGHSASATRAKTFTGKLPRQSRTRSAP